MITIERFGRQLRSREVTSAQITEESLQRIDADNPRLNAFILVMRDEARRQARKADLELAAGWDRGPLHGVPISVKDLFDVRGVPTTAASCVREGHVSDRDATAIAYLRRASAVFIGKTNLHEFVFGTTNEDSAFGPACNPVLAEDYSRALGGREVLRREVDGALANQDAIVLPTLPIPAPPLGVPTAKVGLTTEPVRSLMLRLTQLCNLMGHPAIAMPCGTTRAGLPSSLQLADRRNQTDTLLRVVLTCEAELG